MGDLNKRRFFLFALSFALLFSVLTGTLSNVNAADYLPEVDEPAGIVNTSELKKALAFRSIYGLEQNPETVQRMIAEVPNNDSLEQYGVVLTDAEYRELNFRNDLANEARILRKDVILKNYSSIFSDLYLDHKDGGVIKIGIVDLPNHLDKAEEIKKRFTSKNRIDFFNTTASLKELQEIQNELNELIKNQKVPVEYTEISVEEIKVIAGISKYNENWVSSIKSLSPHIAVKVTSVSEVDSSRTTYTRPLEAGLSIGTCTGAFAAKKWGSPTDTYYYLTAAHCGEIGSSWLQGGSTIGTIQVRNYGGNSDVAGIQISSSNASYLMYDICDTCVPERNKEVGVVQTDPDDDMIGDTVCMSGKVTGWVCGTIVSKTYSPVNWADTGVNFTNLRRANYLEDKGDSGAPVISFPGPSYYIREVQAHGIHKGSVKIDGTKYSVFSHIGYAFSDLGINQIITNKS